MSSYGSRTWLERSTPGAGCSSRSVTHRTKAGTTGGPAQHGWVLLLAERHPFAGGPGHYAAYLENADGYEVELVGN